MKTPELIDFSQERIRLLHFTWVAFFITFYLWFNMAPIATTMLRNVSWLTTEHLKILAIVNVALTIPARLVVGALIDRFGPRIVYSILLIVMSIPVFFFAFGDSFIQLFVARLFLSCIGAGFVIGIRLVADWFPHNMVGRAEGFYAGWGNFGSAWAAMTLPWIALTWFEGNPDGWRWALAINGIVSLVYGILFFFLVKDTPSGERFRGIKKTQPLIATSWADLIQLTLWSFPLFAALGLLVWRLGSIKAGENESMFLTQEIVYLAWGVLAVLFVIHMGKTYLVNIPLLKKGFSESEKYRFSDVASLNTTYFANFGAELAVVSMLPAFFEATYSMNPTTAGIIASSFAFVNLFARPLGGLLSDLLGNRKRVMLIYMAGIAFGFLAMAYITVSWPVWVAVAITILCSVFVQGAEGATFAVIPLIKKEYTGQISGMAGAYGNVGAVTYLVILSLVDSRTFFLFLAAGGFFSVVYCWIFLREPQSSFSHDHGELSEELSKS